MPKLGQSMRALPRVATCLAALAVAAPAAAADFPESDRPIRMTINDWTGQEITTRLMGGVLEEMGYNVEYVQADYLAQFTGLETGDLTVGMEIWETTGKDALEAALETGDVIALGETGMEAIEEWWYPAYMKEKCPGLPDWKALNDCAEQFSTPMTSPKGRYLGGPVTWGGSDEERVEALDLDYEVVHAGTGAALMAELQSAIQRQQPIIAWVYAPHWAPIRFEGEWVEFPEYTDACYEDPEWGPNPDATHDCAKPRGWIKPAAWAGGREVWPAAYTAIENFQIDNEQMGRLIGQVDLEGMPLQAAVDAWLAENEDTWRSWIPQN